MVDFKMPSLGADMEEGALIEWRVKPGDAVRRGQVICVVDTVKAAIDVEVWTDGVVLELLAKPDPDRKLKVGTVLARIQESASAPAAPTAASAPAAATATPATSAASQIAPTDPDRGSPEMGDQRPRMSPAARRKAREMGLDPASLAVSGTLHMRDIEAAVTGGGSAGPSRDRTAGIRKAIAAAMSKSKREIPHYYLRTRIDLARALARLAEENRAVPPAERVLAAALFVRAVALAVRDNPDMNGIYENGEFRPAPEANLGLITALRGGGIIAPVFKGCAGTRPSELMRNLRDLTERARGNTLKSSETSDATITITLLGDLGVEEVLGVIFPPQVAIIGFGAVHQDVVAVEGKPEVHEVVTATLAADHRVSDGRSGAEFLARIRELLEEADELWEA